MSVREAIEQAESILPGEPAPPGDTDPRWQAIVQIGEYIPGEPEAVWKFIETWGGHPLEDLRMAVATCLLEHFLEHHFAAFFPRVEERAVGDRLFADTFLSCWKFDQAEEPANAARFDALRKRLGAGRGR